MPAGHTPGPRQEAGSGGALGQGRVNWGGGQAEPPGWQEARKAGPASANAQEGHAGRHTPQAHGAGGCRRFLSPSRLFFTNSLPPTEAIL